MIISVFSSERSSLCTDSSLEGWKLTPVIPTPGAGAGYPGSMDGGGAGLGGEDEGIIF